MESRLTVHAREALEANYIARDQAAAIIENPDAVSRGETADEYDGFIDGQPVRVVVARGTEPPLVITVYWLDFRDET